MKITGNTILITGATSGIGLGFAEVFMEAGNTVIICGRRDYRLKEIQKKHPDIITRVCDVSTDKGREELFNWIVQKYPKTNVLINNAGIQLKFDLTSSVDMDQIRSEIDVNLYAPIHLSSLFAPAFSKKENAAIINISSGLAFTPLASMPVYCASKAALHSYTLSLRYQLRKTPVKVFEVIPPSVDTELGHDYRLDPTETHGGISVFEFISEAMDAIEEDKLEFAVGQSKNLHSRREELFELLNQHRS